MKKEQTIDKGYYSYTTKQEKMTPAENAVSVIVVGAISFLILSLFGKIVLNIWNYVAPNMFYNFIFGLGVVSGIAFIFSIIEEMIKGE